MCHKCVTSCIQKSEMKTIWCSILLVYSLVTTWSFCNSIHPCSFEQLLGTRAESVLFSTDAPLFLHTFSVQGNIFTLLLLVLLAYFNVGGNEDGVKQDNM